MSDPHLALRFLPFPALATALGLDLNHFKIRKGGEHYGPCPIHQSKTNQTCFSYASDGRYHCFSCNAKGRGAIDLTIAVKGLNFSSAVEFLGGVKVEPDKQKPPTGGDSGSLQVGDKNSDGVYKPMEKDTWKKFQVPCPWLEARCPDADVRERYGVFCYNNPARKSAYSGRVMLPVKSAEGVLYGYLGRSTDTSEPTTNGMDTPKYLFPKGLPKSRFLFGAHELSRQDSPNNGHLPVKVLYLVESPFAVLKFASLGIPAVSPFGWSVSEEQVELLVALARGVVYIPDRNKSDSTGQVLQTLATRLWVRFPPLPDGIDDPEQMTREQILSL